MLLLGLFFVCEIFCTTAIEIKLSKSKSSGKDINIAVDTMLQFDDQENSEDLKFINKIHKFIGKIKTVIENKRISPYLDKSYTFIGFIQKLIKTLTQFNDKDLKYFAAVLYDEITKYHYRGCKFYELTENYKFRRFFARQLDRISSMTADELRNNLKVIGTKIEEKKYNIREKQLMELINSVYSSSLVARFQNILTKINDYKKSKKANLTKIVRDGLRMTIFDHYTKLNRNARFTLKSKIASFFNTSQSTPQLNKTATTASKANKNLNISKGSVYNQQQKHKVIRKHLKANKLKPSVTFFIPKVLTTNKMKVTKIFKIKGKKNYNTFKQEPNIPKHAVGNESRMKGITVIEYYINDKVNKSPKILQKPKYDLSKMKRYYENIKGFKSTSYKKVSPVTFQTFIIILAPKNEDTNKDKLNKPKLAKHMKIEVAGKPPELSFDGMVSEEIADSYHEIEPKSRNHEMKTKLKYTNLKTFTKNMVDTTFENNNNLNDIKSQNSETFKRTKFDHNYFQTTAVQNIKHIIPIKKYTTTTKTEGKKLTFKILYPKFVAQWSGLNYQYIKKGHTQISDRTRTYRQRETSTTLPSLRVNKITNKIKSTTTSSLDFGLKPRNMHKQYFDSIEAKERNDDEREEIKRLILREQHTIFTNNRTKKNVINNRYKKISTVTENISEERQLLNDNNRRSYGDTNLNNLRQFSVHNNREDVKTEINNDSDNMKGLQSGVLDLNDEDHSLADNHKFIRGKPKSKLIIRKTNNNTKQEIISKYEYNTKNRQVNKKYSAKKFVKESSKSVTETQDYNVIDNNTDTNYVSREEIFKSDSQSYTRLETIQSIKNKVYNDSTRRYDSRYKGSNEPSLFYNYTKDEANMNEDMIMKEDNKSNKQNVKSFVTKKGLERLSKDGLKNEIEKGFKQNQSQKKLESHKKKLNVKNATENIVMRSNFNQNNKLVHNRNENKNNRTTFQTTNGTVNNEKENEINFRSEYKVLNTSKTVKSITTIFATTEIRKPDTEGKPLYNSTNFTLTDLNANTVTHINPLSN